MTKQIDITRLDYYEQLPENNTFNDIFIDITHRCNMECKNCYLPNRTFPDMEFERYREFVSKLPNRTMLRIVGAEPTLHARCFDFITTAYEYGHMCVLITNGLKLSSKRYVDELHATGLTHICMSMNGADNNDWYEQIDDLRCAEKKVKALKNIGNRFTLDTGTIVVKDINEQAPGALVDMFRREGIENVTMRIKNVGQLGRYQLDDTENLKLFDLARLCSEQLGLSLDYIMSHYKQVHRYGNRVEPATIEFPLDQNNTERYKGYWIKLTDWDTENDMGIPDPGSRRRGRLTQNWTVAPFYEHIKLNENGY